MSLAHDVAKLMAARTARMIHQARIAAQPIDATARRHRLEAILGNPNPANPRHRRIVELFGKAQARRDHGDIA